VDHTIRIQGMRNSLSEIEAALAGFGRKAEEPFQPLKRGQVPKLGKMIRYADDKAHADVASKVTALHEELNRLEAEMDDAIQEVEEDTDHDFEREEE
jgi:hypothetical protein